MSIIQKLIERAPSLKIAVIGDFIEDRYIIGEVNRISPEAPVPVVNVTSHKTTPGGAGNVFMNLMGLKVDAYLYTSMGGTAWDPPFEDRYRNGVPYRHSPRHSIKTRIMSGNHHIVRFDQDFILDDITYQQMQWREDFELNLGEWDCVVISDYSKGLISYYMAESVIDLCKQRGIPVVVDAKKDYDKFFNASIVKGNKNEFEAMKYTIPEFLNKFDVDAFVVTRGENGMMLVANDSYGVAGHKVPIVDVCGAGDTVTAILAVGEAMRADRKEVISLANRCAAEVCKYPGVYAIQTKDLESIQEEARLHRTSI
jgi:rfaE bifunctional protein kinase chain/domain